MKTKKLTPKQKLFIDEYIATGDLGKSYHKIYNMENLGYCYRAAWGMMNKHQYSHVQQYYQSEAERIAKKYEYGKEKLVRDLLELKKQFDEMLKLANQKDLAAEDEIRYNRLTSLLKGSDLTKINDQLSKLLGFYEPEKLDVKNTSWNISFGEDSDD